MDEDLISGLVEKTTNKWAKHRKAEERSVNAAVRRYDALTRTLRVTVREAAWEVMETAYRQHSRWCRTGQRRVSQGSDQSVLWRAHSGRVEERHGPDRCVVDVHRQQHLSVG
jgi:hypothetical protein